MLHASKSNEGFINEVKWITALLSTEGEARMDNDALKVETEAGSRGFNGMLPISELIMIN